MTHAAPTDYSDRLPHAAIHDRLGIEVIEATVDRVVGRMPVAGNTQPMGLLHGGASLVLAESLGSIGAALNAYPDAVPVGIEINASHHRSTSAGTVTGTALPLRIGKTLSTWQVVVVDDAGRELCTARITCLLRASGA
ncbi:MAG: hotdog fold thioesterase [Actinomycetes bacterium]